MVLKSEKIFESMKPFLDSKREELTKRVNAVYAFEVLPAKGKKVEKIWTVDLKKGDILEGRQGTIDATFILTDDDLIGMATGKLNPQQAFMQGKMKIKGNMGKALKFTPDLLPKMPNL